MKITQIKYSINISRGIKIYVYLYIKWEAEAMKNDCLIICDTYVRIFVYN